ncbi:MAG: hypothetical protein R3F60_04275 [bacterium]
MAATDVRRLFVKGIESVLGCRPLDRFVATCADADGPGLAGGQPSLACRAELQRCGAPTEVGGPHAAVAWPADYAPPICTAADVPGAFTAVDDLCAGPDAPAFCATLDGPSAGDAGPQPLIIVCPECALTLTQITAADSAKVRLDVAVNPALPSGTDIRQPWLYVYWPDGRKQAISLENLAPPTTWYPGASLQFDALSVTAEPSISAAWAGAKAYLVTSLRTPSQTTWRIDASPLRVQ